MAMTASTSLSAGPSSSTLTPASSPRIFSSAARMRGDIGAYHMSELSHLVRTLRCLSDLGGLHIRENKTTSHFITVLRLQECSPRARGERFT